MNTVQIFPTVGMTLWRTAVLIALVVIAVGVWV
jgi:hypothetical protein